MLFGSGTVLVLYLAGGHLPVYAVAQVGLLLLPYEFVVGSGLVLLGAPYHEVGLGRALETKAAVGLLPVKPHRGHVVGVVGHYEAAVCVPPAPIVVGLSRRAVHLVAVLLSLHRDGDALVGERHRLFGEHPEHVHHVVCRHLLRILVHARLVHVDTPLPSGGVQPLVPFLAGCGVGVFQFVQRVQRILIRSQELHVGAAAPLHRPHVLARETPVLVQHLRLHAAENALDGLRFAVVRHRRAVHRGHFAQKTARRVFLVPALVVRHQFVGLVPARLYRHAQRVILRQIVLRIADVVAQQHLRGGVHHLVNACRAHLAVLVAVVQVQFRSVAVPQAVATRGQGRAVLAVEPLAGLLLAVCRAVPQRLHLGRVEPAFKPAQAADGFPSPLLGNLVGSLQQLTVGVDRYATAFQRNEHAPELLRYLQGVRVAHLAANQRSIALFLKRLYLSLQPRSVGW